MKYSNPTMGKVSNRMVIDGAGDSETHYGAVGDLQHTACGRPTHRVIMPGDEATCQTCRRLFAGRQV
jgi:hypothetical protein